MTPRRAEDPLQIRGVDLIAERGAVDVAQRRQREFPWRQGKSDIRVGHLRHQTGACVLDHRSRGRTPSAAARSPDASGCRAAAPGWRGRAPGRETSTRSCARREPGVGRRTQPAARGEPIHAGRPSRRVVAELNWSCPRRDAAVPPGSDHAPRCGSLARSHSSTLSCGFRVLSCRTWKTTASTSCAVLPLAMFSIISRKPMDQRGGGHDGVGRTDRQRSDRLFRRRWRRGVGRRGASSRRAAWRDAAGAQLPAARDPGRRRSRRRLAGAVADRRRRARGNHRLLRRALHGRDREDPVSGQDGADSRPAGRLLAGRLDHGRRSARLEGRVSRTRSWSPTSTPPRR